EHPGPDVELDVEALLLHGRDVGERGGAAGGPRAEHADLARPDVRIGHARGLRTEVRLAGEKRRHRRSATLVGHVEELHVRGLREHLEAGMDRPVDARSRPGKISYASSGVYGTIHT